MTTQSFLTLRIQGDDHASILEALRIVITELEANKNVDCENMGQHNFCVQRFDYEEEEIEDEKL